jgi:pimeloyl-ACP methyl ester carboxylesterase
VNQGLQQLKWIWRGKAISAVSSPPQNGHPDQGAVLLLHGFGASWRHWRHTLTALSAAGLRVYAIDLLGFGGSAKPRSQLPGELPTGDSVTYGFDLWAEQVVDFIAAEIGEGPLQLVGNSIGGVVALNAARLLRQQGRPPVQVVLIDCAQRALDAKRLGEMPVLQRWSRPLLMATVRQRWLIGSLFKLLARPSVVRQVLTQAYPSGGNVDQELLDLLLEPSRDPGAQESFRGFVNLFNDRLAPELLAELDMPVRMLWGEADPWEPVAEAKRWATLYPCIRELVVLPGLGHCPHDEAPDQVNPILLRWLTPNATPTPSPAPVSNPAQASNPQIKP